MPTTASSVRGDPRRTARALAMMKTIIVVMVITVAAGCVSTHQSGGPYYFKWGLDYRGYRPTGEITKQEASKLSAEGYAYYVSYCGPDGEPDRMFKVYQGSTKEQLHIYLLIGQSNMAGRAPLSKEAAGVIPRCYLLNGQNLWEPARNPLNRHSTIWKGLGMQKLNPGYSVSKAILEKDNDISIGLIVNA